MPLARYTSWRCGGPGDRVYVPADRDDLAAFVRQLPPDEPLTVIGLGSNLLVRDGGVRGTVVVLHAALTCSRSRDGLDLRRSGRREPEGRALRRDARLRRSGVPRRHSGHRRRRAGDERRLLRRRDVALRRARRGADARRQVRGAHAADYAIGYRSVRRADGGAAGRHLHRGVVRVSAGRRPRRARAHHGAAAPAHRDAAARLPNAAACSAIRRATTRRA